MPQTKKIKVREAWEALGKNGFEHIRSDWFSYGEDGLIVGGCALGQMALNLGAIPYDVKPYDNNLTPVEDGFDHNLLSQLNRFQNVAEAWIVPDDTRSGAYDPTACGSAIIYWNDATIETGEINSYGEPISEYILKTYEEVSNMAREILEPYFDEEVELVEYNYQVSQVGAEST